MPRVYLLTCLAPSFDEPIKEDLNEDKYVFDVSWGP